MRLFQNCRSRNLKGVVVCALVAAAAPHGHAGDRAKAPDLTPVTWLDTPKHRPVEIVRKAQPLAVIYVAPAAASDAALKRLVPEMIEVVRLSTGATLERVDQPPPADRPAIVIGDCDEARGAGIDAGSLPFEGFEVKTAPNRVFLIGSTQALPPGGEWSNSGSAWAVADFLERFAGVRWYWPAEAGGRCVLRDPSLAVSPAHYRDQPVFRQREYHPAHGWKLPTTARSSDRKPLPLPAGALADGVDRVDMAAYLPLVRRGCSWPYKIKCHEPQNLSGLPGDFREANQDMFALKEDGTRNYRMFCYSSRKALDYLLAGCERTWDQKAGGCSWVTPTCVTVSPGDSKVECHCAACLDTMVRAGGTPIDGVSLIMALFVKQMCEAVKQRWPDKRVIYLPYWNYQECPREVEYPDNLVIMAAMTTYPMPLNVQPENFAEAIERLRAWRAKSSLPVTLWDYCVNWTHGPYQYPHTARDFQAAIKDISAGSFINGWTMGEWSTTAPTLYVWMKALWNPDINVDAVLDEMCARLYGKAGGTAREMMRLECELWERGEWKKDRVKIPGGWYVPESLFPVVWTPDIVARLKALHARALAETAGDPAARQRFLFRTWTFDAFLRDAEAAAGKTGG